MLFERVTNVRVYPLNEVERKMELKESYVSYLMTARGYMDLASKQELLSGFNNAAIIAKIDSDCRMLMTPRPTASTSVPISIMVDSKSTSLTISLSIDNPHLAPTAILDWEDLRKAYPIDAHKCRFVTAVMERLKEGVANNHWNVRHSSFIIKGCGTSRGRARLIASNADAIVELMKQDAASSMKGGVQSAYLLQPFMEGLDPEVRLYYDNGKDGSITFAASHSICVDQHNCNINVVLTYDHGACFFTIRAGLCRIAITTQRPLPRKEFEIVRWREGRCDIDCAMMRMKFILTYLMLMYGDWCFIAPSGRLTLRVSR